LTLDTPSLPLIILFGPPGSGKGTQANLICKELDLLNLSIGNSVRAFVAKYDFNDSFERARVDRLKLKLENGELQDFDDVKYIVEAEIKENISSGKNMLIEGLPRTHEQSLWLADFFTASEVDCLFFHFVLPQDLILERLSHRFYAPGDENPYSSYDEAMSHCKDGQTPTRRKDDENIEVIKHRLNVQYNDCKDDILKTISQCETVKVIDIDSTPTPDKIFNQLISHISQYS